MGQEGDLNQCPFCLAWAPPLAHQCPCAAVPKLVVVTMEELRIFQWAAGNVGSWDYCRDTQSRLC